MNIWIDLTNSPHVNFFNGLIKELQKKHKVLLTCRPLANTIDLLDLHGFDYYVVGKHYGKNRFHKAVGFIIRLLQLYFFLRSKHIDVAISHSSFYSPVVARLLNIRCIYLNDNEHADGNRISFIFADQIMVPEFLGLNKVRRQGAKPDKIIRYPGVKEGIYLWQYQPDSSGYNEKEYKDGKKNIFIRPEPLNAQYYNGKLNFIDDLLIDLKDHFNLTLLPRGKEQGKYYRQKKFKGVKIPNKSIELPIIMENCDLFIGAGGTMTREAAVLGIPTISIYQDTLLDVDQFLIKEGCMVYKKDLKSADVLSFLNNKNRAAPNKFLLDKGRKAHELIIAALLNKTSPNH